MTRASRFRRSLLPLVATVAVVAGLLSAPTAATAAGTASISGTVTDADSLAPLQNVIVRLYPSAGPVEVLAETTTDEFGDYELVDLEAGTYKLLFLPEGATYQSEWYPSGYGYASATSFALADAEALVADFDLDPKGTLSGSVIGTNGASGAPFTVLLYKYDIGEYQGFAFGGSPEWTSSTLEWSFSVPPGTYRIRYSDTRPEGPGSYRTEVHDNEFELADGEEFIVTSYETTVVPTATVSELGPVANERLSGASRYETAVAVSQQFASFNGSAGSYVYVASGTTYPDALSAGPAAALRNAPLLLTAPTSLPTAVRNEIIRLDPETIVVAGGTGVVSAGVFAELETLAEFVVRQGGADRYATSRLLVDDAFTTAATAFIATGLNFPDALAATAAAAKVGGPVILVNGTASSVDAPTASLLDDLGTTDVYIAGGTGVVSSGIEASLASVGEVADVVRLGGADRYATSLAINSTIFHDLDPVDDPQVYLAVGTGFADALAGAALAGAQNPPASAVHRPGELRAD